MFRKLNGDKKPDAWMDLVSDALILAIGVCFVLAIAHEVASWHLKFL